MKELKEKLKEKLKEIGMSEKEAKVYIILLKMGSSTASKISKKSNLNRVTTYSLLESLKNKGFVSYSIKSGVKYFESADPKTLLSSLKEKKENLKSVLPKLKKIQNFNL